MHKLKTLGQTIDMPLKGPGPRDAYSHIFAKLTVLGALILNMGYISQDTRFIVSKTKFFNPLKGK